MKSTFTVVILLGLSTVGDCVRTIKVRNNCTHTVWTAIANSSESLAPVPYKGGWEQKPNTIIEANVEDYFAGNLWGRTFCTFDAKGNGTCLTGDCGKGLNCEGAGGVGPYTMAEVSLNSTDEANTDFFDVSLVNGYNLPMRIWNDKNCGGLGHCLNDLNAKCPPELQKKNGTRVVGCFSPCDAFKTNETCCDGTDENVKCPPTKFSTFYQQGCPGAYSLPQNGPDSSQVLECDIKLRATYTVQFC